MTRGPDVGALFGAAAAETFLGLPKADDLEALEAKIAVLGVPCATPYPSVGPYCAGAPKAIRDAIASHGHEVLDLEATPELASTIGALGVDLVFNVAEGLRGRNREGHVPALCELLGIAYTGSDPATLAMALDKGLAKRICRQAGGLPGAITMSGR